jgi:hypothetical protein
VFAIEICINSEVEVQMPQVVNAPSQDRCQVPVEKKKKRTRRRKEKIIDKPQSTQVDDTSIDNNFTVVPLPSRTKGRFA